MKPDSFLLTLKLSIILTLVLLSICTAFGNTDTEERDGKAEAPGYTLPPSIEVSGKVTDTGTGMGIEGATVMALHMGILEGDDIYTKAGLETGSPQDIHMADFVKTDGSGNYRVMLLPDERYILVGLKENYQEASSGPPVIVTEDIAGLDISLSRKETYEVEVALVPEAGRRNLLMSGSWGDAAFQIIRTTKDLNTPPVYVSAWFMHDGEQVYIKAEWDDPSKDIVHKPWVWNMETNSYEVETAMGIEGRIAKVMEDRVAFKFGMGETFTSNMMNGEDYTADMWRWDAWRSNRGFANDRYHVVSFDSGKRGYKTVVSPSSYMGKKFNRFLTQMPSGSQSDIRVLSEYSVGRWTVVFARALTTNYPDEDVQFDLAGTYKGWVSIYDHYESSPNWNSGTVTLSFES